MFVVSAKLLSAWSNNGGNHTTKYPQIGFNFANVMQKGRRDMITSSKGT
jgi:hypothetical protein